MINLNYFDARMNRDLKELSTLVKQTVKLTNIDNQPMKEHMDKYKKDLKRLQNAGYDPNETDFIILSLAFGSILE